MDDEVKMFFQNFQQNAQNGLWKKHTSFKTESKIKLIKN